MAIIYEDLRCVMGKTFTHTWVWTDSENEPIELTGYSASMKVRMSEFVSTPVIESLSTSTGGIVLGATDGTIRIDLSSAETAVLTPGTYAYNLFLTNPLLSVDEFARGLFTVTFSPT